MKKYTIFPVLFVSILFFSCKKEGYKAPVSNTVAMAGRWWVELYTDANKDGKIVAADGDELVYSYSDFGKPGLVSSNLSSNTSDSILITDQFAPSADQWPFKANFPINYATLSLKPSTGLRNMSVTGESVSLIAGKILTNAATTLSGGKTDSLFLELEFSDDADSYYIYTGHRDTGFPEDQY